MGLVSVSTSVFFFFSRSPELQLDEFTAWEQIESDVGGPAGILFTKTLSSGLSLRQELVRECLLPALSSSGPRPL